MPPECDRDGQGPCGGGGAVCGGGAVGGGANQNGTGGDKAKTTTGPGGDGPGAGPSADRAVDPVTGEVVNGDAGSDTGIAAPIQVSDQDDLGRTLVIVAAVEGGLLAFLPLL